MEICMRLTRAGEYAVRCVLYLAAQRPGQVCNRKAIARAMGIPDQFLGKIAQQLAHAGLIEVAASDRYVDAMLARPDSISRIQRAAF